MWPRFTFEAMLQGADPIGPWVYDGSISMSRDRIAWGGIGQSSPFSGAVSLFARDPSTGVWALEQSLAPDAAGEQFGISVALSGDRLAVGATNVGGAYMGGVYIFHAAGPASLPWLGESCSAHRPQTPTRSTAKALRFGAIHLPLVRGEPVGTPAPCTRTRLTTTGQSSRPVTSCSCRATRSALRRARTLAGAWQYLQAGNGCLLATVRANDVRGAAYLFSRASADPSTPWSETAKLSDEPAGAGGGGAPGDRYATSIAMHEDATGGARFLIGSKHKSIGNASHNGGAFLYSQASMGATVMEEALLVPPAGNTALNGGSLAFAGDVLLIGPYGAGCNPYPQGPRAFPLLIPTTKVYAYTGCGGGAPSHECNLTQILAPIETDDASDRFGSALSLDPDSGMLAISSPLSGANGSLYVYRWTMGPPPPSRPPVAPSPRAPPPSGSTDGTNKIMIASASGIAGVILCAIAACAIAAWLVLRRCRVVGVSAKDVRLDTTSRTAIRA